MYTLPPYLTVLYVIFCTNVCLLTLSPRNPARLGQNSSCLTENVTWQPAIPSSRQDQASIKLMCWNHQTARGPRGFLWNQEEEVKKPPKFHHWQSFLVKVSVVKACQANNSRKWTPQVPISNTLSWVIPNVVFLEIGRVPLQLNSHHFSPLKKRPELGSIHGS